jgi:murein DD-endopeptidase MepM/ murein hydrolase activator NlpD
MSVVRAAALFLLILDVSRAEPLIDFPTDNRALLNGRPLDFFMYVNRDWEGTKSKPWQGGQFGFVRGPIRADGKIVCIQLHEGVDIRPVRRDPHGNPIDEVRAAATGKVVHVSQAANASNYGKYVVVEHLWDGCSYFTLYAHLSSISVEVGQPVRQGDVLGVMGYTGAGIDRERAHTHFEVCMMLSSNFDGWHDLNFPRDPNQHGIYNGLNLVGADPAALLLATNKNPSLRIADFLAVGEPTFKITVRNSPHFFLIRAYPWLVLTGEIADPPAWTISFTRYGIPIKIQAAATAVAQPVVAWVKETGQPYSRSTKNFVTGPPGSPRLTESGLRFAKLLTYPD